MELANIHPRPPAARVFDAGVGDGSVLTRVMRAMHDRYPTMPFYIVGKEISLEDIRLTLQKMADRFFEHPSTVLVLTNLAYADAPWLAVKSVSAASSLVWHELPLAGNSAHRFEQQIINLEPFLAENLKAGDNPFIHDRHQIMKAVKQELGPAGRDLNFNVYADNRSLFRYDMHTLPSEVSESIGTSTLFAAWNAAIYVSQVEDDRLAEVVVDGRYLDATREVLRKNGGLWFHDESFVISRSRD